MFDRVVGELKTKLPKVFALHGVLPEPETEEEATQPEFTATLSPEGQVLLRGGVTDDTQRDLSLSFAKARFGSDKVHSAARVSDDLPPNWSIRVLTSLQALAQLERGAVTVSPQMIEVRGTSYDQDASSAIARLFSSRLGEAEPYALAIGYEEPPAPEDQPLTPEQCQALLTEVQTNGKIAFEPGSATVAAGSSGTLDRVVEVLKECGAVRMEIQGHTDSQGREIMNERLSQARAQSVLNELRARRIPTLTFVARGYGETQPIADNGTEEGREANRRIVFRLENTNDATTDGSVENPEQSSDDAVADPAKTQTAEEGSDQ